MMLNNILEEDQDEWNKLLNGSNNSQMDQADVASLTQSYAGTQIVTELAYNASADNTASAATIDLEPFPTRRRFESSLNVVTTNDLRPEEFIENQTSFNIHLIGPPCSGKTTVVKSALSAAD